MAGTSQSTWTNAADFGLQSDAHVPLSRSSVTPFGQSIHHMSRHTNLVDTISKMDASNSNHLCGLEALDKFQARDKELQGIEETIEKALAFFNSKDFIERIEPLNTIDDPIVSLHCAKFNELYETAKLSQSEENIEVQTSGSSKNAADSSSCTQIVYNKSMEEFNIEKDVPVLGNEMKNSFVELKTLIDVKDNGFPPTNKLPPEEILNLLSKDLKISSSPTVLQRKDDNHLEQHIAENETQEKQREVKQNKKNIKKLKNKKNKFQENIEIKNKFQDKIEIKNKLSKLDMCCKQENKMEELFKIYGGSNKVNKSYSDSGSKSEVSRRTSSKKMDVLNNCSSKTSTVALSKKKKSKIPSNNNDYFLPDRNVSLRDRMKKSKQKNNTSKLLRIPSVKRKITNQNTESIDCKLSKNHKTVPKESKYIRTNKITKLNCLGSKNYEKNQKQMLQNQSQPKRSHEVLLNLNVQKENQSYKLKNQARNNNYDMKRKKSNTSYDNQSQVIDNENFVKSKEFINNKQIYNLGSLNNCLVENSDLPNTEVYFESIKDDFISETGQHYALPIQSSRSKEVDRFLSGHYRQLPFVIGQSTSKSHNLWVNIQETLALIKKKIPDLTVVQNIVHESDNERPLSVSSKFTSKTMKKSHQCPAIITDGLYDIPEDEEGIKSWEDNPQCIQANIDPQRVRPRCCCAPQQSMSYKKVLHQLFAGTADMSATTLGNKGDGEEFVQNQFTEELKRTLISFTQEFEDMNKKYEEMLSDPNVNQTELLTTEMLLKNKEVEIQELLSKFNEVKLKTERIKLEGTKIKNSTYNLESIKSNTSFRMAQTLRRVQTFKDSLKNNRRNGAAYLSKIASY